MKNRYILAAGVLGILLILSTAAGQANYNPQVPKDSISVFLDQDHELILPGKILSLDRDSLIVLPPATRYQLRLKEKRNRGELKRMVSLKPDSGSIEVMGQSIAKRHAWQVAGNIGTAFQNPNSQFFKLTVEEEVLVGPKVQNCLDDQWISELVAIFRLEHLLQRAPFKLSGGEKKRVAFAAALAAKPKILVLDEPTAGQDSSFRKALIQCLHRLAGQGAAVLVVTHALNFLESLTNRWLIMAGGRLIADATPQDIMADENLMQRAGLMSTEAFQWKQLKTNVS